MTIKEINSYSSPFNLGHKALEDFWTGDPVYVQEKIDGSQISFGVRDGEIFLRSRNQMIDLEDAGMFGKAVETVRELSDGGYLADGYTYRGEYLQKLRHNTIKYDRVPYKNIILFDIDKGDQDYIDLRYIDIVDMLEVAPVYCIYTEKPSYDDLKAWLDKDSVLGGTKIEGIVLKNYTVFGRDKKVLMAKLVSENFKEVHDKSWKDRNPGANDVVARVIEKYATHARWEKALQHLMEAGELQQAPQDIPNILKEVNRDVLSECEDEIKEILFNHAWKNISRGLTRGLPEWYKEKLASEF